ncbi:MAG: outer spore coat protein CotE [Bacilli bacterium]
MSTYKEIVTKAVVGKGKKYYKNTYTVNTDNNPDTVLGCWVINHKFSGSEENGKIVINGSFDVNLWYSYDNNTKTSVITKNIPYKEVVTVSQKETTDSSKKDIIVRSLKQPSCVSAKEDGSSINIEIEKELGVEIVGDTKVKVAIEEDEEPWDELPEEVTEETEKEIEENIDPDYIKEEK